MSREMKDSGIEWIGEVPSVWEVKKMKYYGTLDSSGVDKKIREDENTYKSVHYMDVYRGSLTEIVNKDSYLIISTTSDKAERCLLKKGDVLFTNSSETPEDMGHSTVIKEDLENTLFGYHLIRFRPIIEFSLNFEKYLFGSDYMRKWFSYCSIGMTRYGLNGSSFSNALLIVPPLAEQQKIADYLDEKVSEINNIIIQTTLSIEEYKKYKYALITKCVTNGLNLGVSTKSTNGDWLGEIPKSWNYKKLKYIFSIKKEIAGKEGFDILSVTQSGLKIKDISKNEGQISADYSKYQIVDKGDFVMNHMDLLTGWVDHSEYYGVTSPDYRVFRFQTPEEYSAQYYKYIMQICYKNKIFYGLGQGVSNLGRWRLQTDKFLNFMLPVPDKEEQHRIADYLDKKCCEMDNLIIQKKQLLKELESYKKSLIYECVTGKREVK